MYRLSQAELKKFEDIADNSPVTMIVVADDDPRYTIVFASNMLLFGYADNEVRGFPLAELLIPEIRDKHSGWMRSFKEKAIKEGTEGISKKMADGRLIPGYTKAGTRKNVNISINFTGRKHRNFFLAFCQAEGEIYYDVDKIYNLRSDVEKILDKVKSEYRKKAELMGGGTLGGALAIFSFFTPFWPAIKNAGVSWWATVTSNVATSDPSSLTVTAEITDKQRKRRLMQVRNELRGSMEPELIAIAYYEIEEKIGGLKAWWIADTPDPKNREVWFFDARENQLHFGLLESQLLTQHDCVLKQNAANLPNVDGQPKLNVIFCPTFEIKNENGLPKVKIKGLIAGAYPSTVTALEPHATHIWEVGPSLETVSGQ